MDDTGVSERNWAAAADRWGVEAVSAGEPTAWFDRLWSAAERDEIDTPWARDQPYPLLPELLTAAGIDPPGPAVVVGAGLGADAEHLAGLGYDTTAFDLSPAAVRLASARHPASTVHYRVADLLDLPDDLVGRFALVVEIFTVQAMPPTLREPATAGIRSLLAVGGQACVVQFVRPDDEPVTEGPPWMLDRAEMQRFAAPGVELVDLAARESPRGSGARPLWTGRLHRTG